MQQQEQTAPYVPSTSIIFWHNMKLQWEKACLSLLLPAAPLWRSHHSMLAFASAALRNPEGGRTVIRIQKPAVALASLLHLGVILKLYLH